MEEFTVSMRDNVISSCSKKYLIVLGAIEPLQNKKPHLVLLFTHLANGGEGEGGASFYDT